MKKSIIKTNKKGSILVLVLWALGLLSVFAVYLGLGVRGRIDFLDRIQTRNQTCNIAQAGIKQAISGIGNLSKERSYLTLNDISSSTEKVFSLASFQVVVFKIEY